MNIKHSLFILFKKYSEKNSTAKQYVFNDNEVELFYSKSSSIKSVNTHSIFSPNNLPNQMRSKKYISSLFETKNSL